MKKLLILLALAVLLAVCAAGCGALPAEPPADLAAPDPDLPGTPHATSGSIVVRGFEWGPGVPKVIVQLDEAVDAVFAEGAWLSCRGERTVEAVYLSDSLGIETAGPSQYVTLQLETSFDSTGSPFEMDMQTEHNIWADTYIVQTGFAVMSRGVYFDIGFSGDCIDNRVCPELERFTVRDSFTGTYPNYITGTMDELTIAYAAYEPDILRSWEQNPLIVWLHGRGEGGDDIEKTILGNEVSALTEGEIQRHFISGEQVGAYVLVPQCPTYWLDPGDGRESRGDVPSLYTQALMDTIAAYVASNPDVDQSRIYLMGASNGGYMTLNMLIEYPDYFAAGVSCSTAYAYNMYAKDWQGNYRTFFNQYIRTRWVYLTEEKVRALTQTPLWMVAAMTDTIVSTFEYTMPIYQALLSAGADNAWCSLYFEVIGTQSSDTRYLGHWSWVYLLNDQVAAVQDPERIRNAQTPFGRFWPTADGGTERVRNGEGEDYASLFDWLNDQHR